MKTIFKVIVHLTHMDAAPGSNPDRVRTFYFDDPFECETFIAQAEKLDFCRLQRESKHIVHTAEEALYQCERTALDKVRLRG